MSSPSARLRHLASCRRALLALCVMALASPVPAAGPAAQAAPARRVVSLNPSLTETLVALDAAASLVGVDEDSARRLAEVAGLPTVGGLFNPSLESVVALEPDLVAMVPGIEQRALRERLEDLRVPVLVLPNLTLEELLASIEILGARVGRAAAATARVEAIRRTWADVAREVRGRPRVRSILVLQRDPLYVVGRGSWIDAMLGAAGAENLGAELAAAYPQAAVEWLVAAAPELLLDASEDVEEPMHYWSRWPSLPALASGRAVALDDDLIRPGPWLDRSLRRLAAAVREPGP
jgi:iron complex transport system substrate-binding protein